MSTLTPPGSAPGAIPAQLTELEPTVRNALRSPKMLRTEVLAGLVVALALIPEAIAFSIIVGVDPRIGLFASFTMAVSIAFLGGRPAMISAATGAIALVLAPLFREYGYDYLIATVLLGGVLQVVLAERPRVHVHRRVSLHVPPRGDVRHGGQDALARPAAHMRATERRGYWRGCGRERRRPL